MTSVTKLSHPSKPSTIINQRNPHQRRKRKAFNRVVRSDRGPSNAAKGMKTKAFDKEMSPGSSTKSSTRRSDSAVEIRC
jgi:hypothetical protein